MPPHRPSQPVMQRRAPPIPAVASEPGRPRDAEGVKALAVAARKCFEHYRPGGMTVYAGSIILEPGLTGNDLGEVAKLGVWLAKAGFGAFANA